MHVCGVMSTRACGFVCVCTHRGASKCDRWGLPGDTETAAGGGEASGAGGGDGDRGCGLWSDSHTDIVFTGLRLGLDCMFVM